MGETERASEVAQHQSLGVRMEVDLLVHPVGNRVAVVAIPTYLDFGHSQALATAGVGVVQIIGACRGFTTTCSYFRPDSAMSVTVNRKMAKVQTYKTGLKRQNPINLTTRMPIVNSEAISRMSEKERTAFEACILNP